MKKGFKIIQINGFRGMLTAIGIGMCLVAGFVGFPGIVLKYMWNFTAANLGVVPPIDIAQGILLWAILVVAYFTFKKNGFLIQFRSSNDLTNAEMAEVMERIRMEHQKDILAQTLMNAKDIDLNIDENIKKEDSELK